MLLKGDGSIRNWETQHSPLPWTPLIQPTNGDICKSYLWPTSLLPYAYVTICFHHESDECTFMRICSEWHWNDHICVNMRVNHLWYINMRVNHLWYINMRVNHRWCINMSVNFFEVVIWCYISGGVTFEASRGVSLLKLSVGVRFQGVSDSRGGCHFWNFQMVSDFRECYSRGCHFWNLQGVSFLKPPGGVKFQGSVAFEASRGCHFWSIQGYYFWSLQGVSDSSGCHFWSLQGVSDSMVCHFWNLQGVSYSRGCNFGSLQGVSDSRGCYFWNLQGVSECIKWRVIDESSLTRTHFIITVCILSKRIGGWCYVAVRRCMLISSV